MVFEKMFRKKMHQFAKVLEWFSEGPRPKLLTGGLGTIDTNRFGRKLARGTRVTQYTVS